MEIKYDNTLDFLKGALIILVILGHILQLGEDILSCSIINWIYTFHMPLFIMVSGYFTNLDSINFRVGTIKLVETYIVFQFIRCVIEGQIDVHSLLVPHFALWYLLSLFYWRIMMCFMVKIMKVHKTSLLFIAIIASLVATLVPYTTLLSFQRTFAFLPFFVIGYLCRDIDYRKCMQKISFVWATISLVIPFIFFYIKHQSFLMEMSGTEAMKDNGGVMILRPMLTIISLIMSICFMKVIFCLRHLNIITMVGKKSLHFYIFHTFIYMDILRPLCKSGYLETNFIWLIIYTFITVAFLWYISKFSFFKYALNPIFNILRWKNQ